MRPSVTHSTLAFAFPYFIPISYSYFLFPRGTRVAQLGEHATLNLRVVEFKHHVGHSLLKKKSSFKKKLWSTWVAQLVKCLTLDFGSGHGVRVVRSSPPLGSVLGVWPA